MSDPKVMIGRFADSLAYQRERDAIGAYWLRGMITNVSFLGEIKVPEDDEAYLDCQTTRDDYEEQEEQK